MNSQNFILQPWNTAATRFQISGHVSRSQTSLHLCYELRGKLTELLLPAPNAAPSRKDNLWQSTCFEFFIAPQGLPRYWEVNLSLSGDWNVYAFDIYRAGMREETALSALPFTVREQVDCCRLTLDFPSAKLINPQDHQRQSFLLALPPPASYCERKSWCRRKAATPSACRCWDDGLRPPTADGKLPLPSAMP